MEDDHSEGRTMHAKSDVLSPRLAVIPMIAALCVGCGDEAVDAGGANVGDTHMTFEEFLDKTYKEPGGVWIADGDTPFETLEQLREFYETHFLDGALAIMTSGGVDVRWDDTQKLNLTYCVSTTFDARYSEVVNAMSSATGAW